MPIAYIALGSNLGDRWETLRRRYPEAASRARSACYRELRELRNRAPQLPTRFWRFPQRGRRDRDRAIPERSPETLLRIERQFGRIRNEPNSPRTLDLDLILYDDHVINTPELVVPHPRMHERDFVLIPLAELHAKVGRDAFHPVLKRTAMELLESLPPAPAIPRRQTLAFTSINQTVRQHSPGFEHSSPARRAASAARSPMSSQLHGAAVIRHGRRAKSKQPNDSFRPICAN